MNRYIIATIKPWNIKNFKEHFAKNPHYILIDTKEKLTCAKIKKFNPRYIFFPHWSWIIPREVWSNFECIVFHITDLPYGRGGSPLQNLIIRGQKATKISAIQVNGGLDTGPIYMKYPVRLIGNAQKIYERISHILFTKMIPFIITNNPIHKEQTGKPVTFTRRLPHESKIPSKITVEKLYDYIRMLDAETYPKAFLETDTLKIEFSQSTLHKNKLTAYCEIYEKK